jgi:hypothetical protein
MPKEYKARHCQNKQSLWLKAKMATVPYQATQFQNKSKYTSVYHNENHLKKSVIKNDFIEKLLNTVSHLR